MTQNKHTATPWNYNPDENGTIIRGLNGNGINNSNEVCEVLLPKIREKGYDQCAEIQLANAALIVRAVNSHDLLVKAVEEAYQARLIQIQDESDEPSLAVESDELLKKYDEALKQAEEA